ncbi:mitochondrial import receptor subunit TOM20 homolog [Condylostylus longicornis]|uniref:mitochondrial import receptor subunit TOM20 homolog n=1 Tax=Condylostylus longicornis TaxID=2530218 RepID=UPI00244DCAED|nr:mitochondrial import receptor subunit TOM20 homolog [Condylostylus longicornis]
MEINKTTIGIAAGVAGTLFLGYCIYFDKKRRSDPEYKKKVRERRRRQKKAGAKNDLPNFHDQEAIERYFLQEIQLGETLIATGDFEKGVEHLANAIVVCGQPTKLLQILQKSLPAQVFAMLIQKMQELGSRTAASEDKGPRIVAASSSSKSVDPAAAAMMAGLGGDIVIGVPPGASLDDLE